VGKKLSEQTQLTEVLQRLLIDPLL